MIRWLILGLLTLLTTTGILAQDLTCNQLRTTAFDMLREFCAEQLDDTLCYGNPTASINFNDMASDDMRFSLSGDTVPVNTIAWFSTSTEANTWGTSRAQFHAYPATTLQSQAVTMLVFGDVILTNNGTENITIPIMELEITTQQGANIRSLPTTNARILEPALSSVPLRASGRLEDGTWVRVHTGRGAVGWVSTSAVSGDFIELPIVSEDEQVDPLILPLQAFDFQSGLPDSSCVGGISSGILLQTAQTDTPLEFTINSATISLSGTIYLQAHPDTGMLVYVTEGTATVSALEETVEIGGGYASRIFMESDDEGNLSASEPPGIPRVYDYTELLALPLDLLPRTTTVAFDIYTIVAPRPAAGNSPIAGMALNAKCTFTVGETGANLRSGPGTSFPIVAVMGYRESAQPIGRTIGIDGAPWWKIAEGIWVRIDTTVTGGDCTAVSNVTFDG